MLNRLKAVAAGVMERLHGKGLENVPAPGTFEPDSLRDIEFRTVNPDSAAGDHILCPVTRRELRSGDKIYQCRACRTAYSALGWDFLKRGDGGRCCACGLRKTVYPVG